MSTPLTEFRHAWRDVLVEYGDEQLHLVLATKHAAASVSGCKHLPFGSAAPLCPSEGKVLCVAINWWPAADAANLAPELATSPAADAASPAAKRQRPEAAAPAAAAVAWVAPHAVYRLDLTHTSARSDWQKLDARLKCPPEEAEGSVGLLVGHVAGPQHEEGVKVVFLPMPREAGSPQLFNAYLLLAPPSDVSKVLTLTWNHAQTLPSTVKWHDFQRNLSRRGHTKRWDECVAHQRQLLTSGAATCESNVEFDWRLEACIPPCLDYERRVVWGSGLYVTHPAEHLVACESECECGPECGKLELRRAVHRLRAFGLRYRLQVKRVPHARCGLGVFAVDDISAGEVLAEYSGVAITAKEAEKREEVYEQLGWHYMWDMCRAKHDEEDDSASKASRKEDWVIDSTFCGNVSRFVNHSCEPNMLSQDVCMGPGSSLPFMLVVLITARHIKADEELTLDYCPSYPFQRAPGDSTPGTLACLCGTTSCRKWVFLKSARAKASHRSKAPPLAAL